MIMKRTLIAIALSAFFLASVCSQAQELNLSGFWKFHLGDSAQWKSQDYNDSHWKDMPTGIGWEELDKNVDGFAWYRKTIVIPAHLKKLGSRALELYINRINDADQTFVNGQLVGVTDNPYQPDVTPSQIQRRYMVSFDNIKWDQKNTIAIRVFNIKNYGGLFSGPIVLRPLILQNFDVEAPEIALKTKLPETLELNSKTMLKINLSSHSRTKLAGKLNIAVTADVFETTDQQTFAVELQPESTMEVTIKLPANRYGCYRVFADFAKDDGSHCSSGLGIYQVHRAVKLNQLHAFSGAINGPAKTDVPYHVASAFNAPSFNKQTFDGYLKWRMDINLEKRLLKTDTLFLLNKFRKRGYLSDGKPYDGEHIGKFFNAACNTWLFTQNEQLASLMHQTMQKWLATQGADGYLGTYLPAERWSDWDVWVHKYDLIGLLSYYRAFNSEEALQAARKIGDLLVQSFGDEPDKKKIEKVGRHVGMASMSVLDPMVDLYHLTGEKKYLDFCEYIVSSYENEAGPKLFSTLVETGSVEKTANAKAYEMISNLVGLVKLYRISGESKLLQPALVAWNDIVSRRLYITGSTSQDEKFQHDNHYECTPEFEPSEGCVTVTWMQLNMQLYYATGHPEYLNYFENAYYNQLLAAENVKNGCVSYFTPMQEFKYAGCGVTCCMSSVSRGISMIPEIAWGNYGNGLCVNIYSGGSFATTLSNGKKTQQVSLSCKTDFPQSGQFTYQLAMDEPAVFPLFFRVPEWCSHFAVTVGGKVYKDVSGGYLEINRKWMPNESIALSMHLPLLEIPGKYYSYPSSFAFQYGPMVLAVDRNFSRFSPFHPVSAEQGEIQLSLSGSPKPKDWLGPLVFSTNLKFEQTQEPVMLIPFAEAGQNEKPFGVWLTK
jgi:DUF1680 family protein